MEAIEFHFEESRFLALLLIFIYMAPLSSLFLLKVHIGYKILMIGFVHYFLVKNWKIHINRKSRQAIVRVWQDTKGNWGLQTRQGKGYRATLLPETFKSHFLIVLRLKTKLKIYNVLIPYDSLSQNEYRILCRHLVFF